MQHQRTPVVGKRGKRQDEEPFGFEPSNSEAWQHRRAAALPNQLLHLQKTSSRAFNCAFFFRMLPLMIP